MKIRIYNDLGVSKESIKHCLYTLKLLASKNYSIEYITAQEIIEGNWQKNTRLLVLPGGRDLCYVEKLQGKGDKQIQDYLMNGGNFLGICAGSYYSGNYLEFAKSTKIEVIGVRDLAIYKGLVKGPVLAPYYYNSNKGASAAYITIEANSGLSIKDCHAFYNGGGYFVDAENVKNTEIIARYENFEAAIIKCTYGKGTAILSGIHFEYDPAIIKRKYLSNIREILNNSNGQRIILLNYIFKILSIHGL
ncbi:BPL-N domain-containing protein [Rickettsia endosymbiont of Halotydeus destructor]|uniref:BPL-N domain-containing protein n=1 Tax=Rickettsia endosymbiont of Halotydeus destructor TaxID=2996754 RepID=UPI003BB15073